MRLVAAAIASLAALALIGFLVLRGNEQTHVEVRAGDAMPSNPNRSDDYGADTMRAYLTAALACDGTALTRYGTRIDEVERLCDASGAEAEVARDELDARGRALWKLSGPADLYLWVAQQDGGWRVTAATGPPQG